MTKIRDDFEGVTFVYDEDSTATRLQAGDEIPEWATVGKHLIAQHDRDTDANAQHDGDDVAGVIRVVDVDGDQPVEPPRAGRGSGKVAWQEYATARGVTFPKDATRDQIVELVDAATSGTEEGNGGDPADGDPDGASDEDAADNSDA